MCDFGGGDVEVLGYLCGGFAECFECVAVVSELECGLVDGVLFFESLGDGGFNCGDGVEFGLEFLAGFFACGEVGCGGGFFLCHLHNYFFLRMAGNFRVEPQQPQLVNQGVEPARTYAHPTGVGVAGPCCHIAVDEQEMAILD